MTMLIQPARFGLSTPPDLSGDPHRYWRARFFSRSSNVASVAKLELRGAVGGPDLAIGQTVIGGTDWNGSVATLFDADLSSFAYVNDPQRTSTQAWAGIDFGADAGNWPVIIEILLRNGNPNTSGQGATAASIEYSDDGATWVPAWSVLTANWTNALVSRVFTKPVMPHIVFDAQGAAVDTGPYAAPLTAIGNAAISAGRFIFDGAGDYYQNLAVEPNIAKLGWQATVEIFGLIAANAGFKGVFNVGGSSQRILVSVNNGVLQLWSNLGNTITVNGAVSTTVPKDIKLQIDGAVARLYVNGLLGGTGAVNAGPAMENSIHLGTDPLSAGDRSLNGSFSGVRITQGLV